MNSSINELLKIGLTENEAKTYYFLLRKELFTATEISSIAGVSRSKIYDVLTSLIKKGLCSAKPGKVRKFAAEDPHVAFNKLMDLQKSKLDRMQKVSESLAPIFKNRKENSSPLDVIQVFGTTNSIIQKFENLKSESKNEVLSLCKPPYAMSETMMADITDAQKETSEHGVNYKSVYEIEWNNIDLFVQNMKAYLASGEIVKVIDHLPLKLHIFDTAKVLFSLINYSEEKNTKSDYTFVLIEHGDLVEAFQQTFNTYWEKAIPAEEFIENLNRK